MNPDRPTLEIEDAENGTSLFPLAGETTRVGRRPENDIRIPDARVSKYHAEIAHRGEDFVVLDVGSKGGVFVNGGRVTEQPLADGDVITLGGLPSPRLVFRREGAGRMAARPPDLHTTATHSFADHTLDKLARFLEFSRSLGGRLTLPGILENVVDLATDLTGAERGFLILGDRDGRLSFRVARRRDRSPIPIEEVRVSETIVREVLDGGVPRIVEDVQGEESLVDLRSVAFLGLRSAVALPLRRSDASADVAAPMPGVFGVLYLDNQEARNSFSQIDRGILEALARDASSAIENARLIREAEDRRRLQEEMDRAREIQEALLPRGFWREPHFEVAGCCLPSRHLGGDYYDQFRLPDGRCGFVIADVAGKGVPAALLAAALQGCVSSEIATPQALDVMTARLNRAIGRRVPDARFVTFACCVLAPDGALTYVNAGHLPPLVVGPDGVVVPLETGGTALGILEDASYRAQEVRLRPGDLLTLYTDGVVEATDAQDGFFGDDRLAALLAATRHLAPEEIVDRVRAEVEAFSGRETLSDDVTLLVIKYLGDGAARD